MDGPRDLLASDEYWVRLVESKPPKRDDRLRILFNLIAIFELVSPLKSDPNFWIIAGRHGSDQGTGVRVARDRRSAERALSEVEQALTTMTPKEFRDRLINP